MKISNTRNFENIFLIVASLLVAIINTVPFLTWIFKAGSGHENPFMNRDFMINRSIYYVIHSFISILIFAYFNFRWKDFLLPKKAKKWLRNLLLAVYNIALFYLLLKVTVLFAEYTVGNPFGKDKAMVFYFWRYLAIYPPAILISFILYLITRARIIEIENIQLKEENISSQLKSLKDQINPHFLFNTLNTLSSVIRLDRKEEGLRFVQDLSNVYRYILESDKNNMVQVKSELNFLDSYLFMLRKRFDDKLIVNVDISQKTREAQIPPMVLQTLIENAIKHNEVSKASPLKIWVYNKNGNIVVKNELHPKSNDQESFGLGLPNLMKRYELITGKDIIIRQTDTEFIVELPIIE